jgi:pilus assembly protein CpaC
LIFVTPELVDAMDAEEVPGVGPGQSTESPCDTDLYWRGFIEVPKGYGMSCDGINCHHGRCGPNGRCLDCGAAPQGAEVIGPGMQASRTGIKPTMVAKPGPTSAPRTTNPKVAQNRSSRTPTPAKSGTSSQSKPGLIGPVGYDVLK